ncbi:hypothetical protein VOLCADRAFT_108259 [Volvox carteri f. nagariensis]|uniref:DUF659 domain-containing protein n=1 Tax=Volvox carteri f. nagariensis TaxID=3068 RepID=D8UJ57_VOLCA|nr:uncharacterized protein VOLCADRAFT_108259 [Volvox carteri f. nagariensis]EFJ40248.1 hypothetical protein VOLCADRAFT_108259 [Volvox carteri f. nagariensis]|eukprot:XP_002958688.1 hypothetical protein VOLCADRAFT_108259 [Volvox carteri f. nagariensis]
MYASACRLVGLLPTSARTNNSTLPLCQSSRQRASPSKGGLPARTPAQAAAAAQVQEMLRAARENQVPALQAELSSFKGEVHGILAEYGERLGEITSALKDVQAQLRDLSPPPPSTSDTRRKSIIIDGICETLDSNLAAFLDVDMLQNCAFQALLQRHLNPEVRLDEVKQLWSEGIAKQAVLRSRNELFNKLRNQKKNAKTGSHWDNFNVEWWGGVPKLVCLFCDEPLSAVNPSFTNAHHIKQGACKAIKQRAASLSQQQQQSGTSSAAAGPSTADQQALSKRRRGIDGQTLLPVIPATLTGQVVEELGMFFYRNNVPIHLIEKPELRNLFGLLGVTLPNRKQLMGPMLDRAYSKVKAQVAQVRQRMCGQAALCSDGWRKRAAEQGVPLINFMLLLPTGSAFLRVVRAAGVRKDAQYIKKIHLDVVAEAFTKPDDCIGFVMDNTATNLAAIQLLRIENPRWLGVGCGVHGMALVFKDLAKEKNVKWAAKIFNASITISTVVGDSERIRALLGVHQMEKYGKKSAITANTPTRFAVNYFVLSDVLANEDALKAMVRNKEAWAGASDGTSKAQEFKAMVEGEGSSRNLGLFSKGAKLAEFCEPISKALHKLECDRPMLSQMYPVWKALLATARDFDEANTDCPGLYDLLKRRYDKQVNACWFAAFLLDPRNIDVSLTNRYMLPLGQLELEEKSAAKVLIQDLAAGKDAAKRDRVGEEWTRLGLGIPKAFDEWSELMRMHKEKLLPDSSTRVMGASLDDCISYWDVHLAAQFPLIASAAIRLLLMHASTCSSERNWSAWGLVYTKARNRLAIEWAEKIVYIRGNAGLQGNQGAAADEVELILQQCEEDEQEQEAQQQQQQQQGNVHPNTQIDD